MNSMTEICENLNARDAEILEKQAALLKQAEEEDAAGRIMARGFADELAKLANMPGQTVPDTPNDLGGVRNYRLGADGKASGVNARGQKVQSGGLGFMAPKPPAPPKPGR